MSPDFRAGYVPPGVYVTADTSTVASAVGAGPTVVCLVGPGLGYQTYVDHVVFVNTTDSEVLTQEGINQNSVAVSSTVNGTTTNYILGTDYTLSSTDSSAPDSVTTIAIVGSGSITPGTTVDVNYRYADAGYYGLNQFGDFQSLANVYGQPFNNVTGAIQSPLTLAAQIAFENGANIVFAVAPTPSGSLSDQYNAAYALTLTNYDISLVVPVFPAGTGSGTLKDLDSATAYIAGFAAHLGLAEDEGFPRCGIFGVPDTFDSSVTPDQLAVQFNNRRVVFVWPNRLNYYSSTLNGTQVIGGSYLAAACAGILANNPTAQGLTKRQVTSISSIATDIVPQQTTSNKNLWSSKGVAVLESNRSGQLTIRHGTTTAPASTTNREFNIVRCQDELFKNIQLSLESAELVGTPIDAETTLAVKGIISGALEAALGANTIQGYNNLAVRQQTLPNGDPTAIEAVFQYKPTYPLNYITVTFSFDLSTGDITSSTDTSGV
jgi:hypothetical protein